MRKQTVLSSALSLLGVALLAGCSGDSPLPVEPDGVTFNVINATPGSVLLCPQGPAGNYSYSVTVETPADYTYGGGGTFPPAVVAAAQANHSLPMGNAPVIGVPSPNFNCVQVFRVNASVNYQHPGNGAFIDVPRLVTVTQTGAVAAATLDSILVTTSDQPGVDVKHAPPAVTIVVDPNFFHGHVASFWNSVHPAVGQRTIGFWSQWSSCSAGNQAPVLDQTIASFPGGSVLIGDLSVSTCAVAVALLKKSDVVTGANRANDAAYGLAAQLLAARLNVQAGASTCTAANTAMTNGQTLLANVDFTGTGPFLGPGSNSTTRNQANTLATTLDQYNNGNLC